MTKFICCIALFLASFSLWADGDSPSESCRIIDLDRTEENPVWSIRGLCKAQNGGKYYSSLPVRDVINLGGRLAFKNESGLGQDINGTCKYLNIDSDLVLGGLCPDEAKQWKWSSLSLDKVIYNYNGTLVYPGGNFSDIGKTCSNIGRNRESMSAYCKAENGSLYYTVIRIRGVNNSNGVLVFEKDSSVLSKFSIKCRELMISPEGILSGKCPNNQKEFIWSSLDLSKVIGNFNGTLVYREEK